MNAAFLCVAIFWLISPSMFAQSSDVIPMDQEQHHRIVLHNKTVSVFDVVLSPHDALPVHRHVNADIAILLEPSTTVSSTAGQADILTISKVADVIFAPAGLVHSARNIGTTPYHTVVVELLQPQTGPTAICGEQLSHLKTECRAIRMPDVNAPRADLPKFSTDQVSVTFVRLAPHQGSSFGEQERDLLIVPVDNVSTVPARRPAPNQPLPSGTPLWIARHSEKQSIKNNSDTEVRFVVVEFKP